MLLSVDLEWIGMLVDLEIDVVVGAFGGYVVVGLFGDDDG